MLAVIVCNAFATNDDSTRENAGGALVSLNNGESVFERQLRILGECGITRFLIRAGTKKARLEPLTSQEAFRAFEFAWTDDPVYNRGSNIMYVCDPDRTLEEDAIILSESLVFNRKSMERFIDGPGPAFAVKAPDDAHGGALIVQAFDDGRIRAVGPPAGEPNGDCFALQPLCRLKKGVNSLKDARAVVWDGLLEDVPGADAAGTVSQRITCSDMMEQRVLGGAYSILKLEELLARGGVVKPLIVSDARGSAWFLKAYLERFVQYAVFETTSDAPDYRDVLRGARLFAEEECDGIISIGGDGAAEMAKLIRLFSRLDDAEGYSRAKVRLTGVKHIAVPDGSGDGKEAIPEAVMVKDGKRERIAHPGLLPDIVLLEPKYMHMLEEEQNRSAVLDVVCRCIDSLWAVRSDDVSSAAAKEALSAVLDNCFSFLNGSIGSAAKVMRAQVLCAKAVYISGVTAAYAAGRGISSLLGIPRGRAAALCAPYFWEHYARNLPYSHTDAGRKKLAAALFSIKEILSCKTNYEMTELLSFFAYKVSMTDFPDVSGQALNGLPKLLQEDALVNSPVSMDAQTICGVCRKAFAGDEFWRRAVLPRGPKGIHDWESFVRYWKACLYESVLMEIRKIGLELLDETVRICEETGLQYFLSYGTLLGAARCEGFLPWDYSIEVSMPRGDYERFIAVAVQQMRPGYYIHYSGNDPYCWFDCVRVCKEGTHLERKKDRFFYARKRGVYISVYPVDNLKYGTSSLISMRYRICRGLSGIIHCRLNPRSRKLRLRGRVILRLSRVFPIQRLHAMRHRIPGRRRKGDFALLGCRYALEREAVHKKLIYPLEKMEFEGGRYNVPRDWDSVLKRLYGDYEAFPLSGVLLPPKPLRVGFGPGKMISLFEPKTPKTRKQGKGRLSFKARVRRTIRRNTGRLKKLLRRTGTRIGGFFRLKGLMISRNSRTLASYRDKYAGQRCFLIGNGPSLKAEDLDRLKGEITFGCNLIYKIFDQTSWRPTFYCVSDSTITRIHSHDIMDNMDGSQLMIREFAFRYMHVRPWDAVRLPYVSVDRYKVRGNILAYHYISHATVMSMMMELAFFMGFKEIYLIGVDGTSASAKGGHFTDHYFGKQLKAYADQVKQRVIADYDPKARAAYLQTRTLDVFAKLREHAEKRGIRIFNATRGGVVEVFERADFDEVTETEKKDLKQ